MSEYRGGFTVHGLNWLCTGSLPEIIVWSLAILLVLGFAIYMTNGYVSRYLRYEWRTEIRYEETSSILQPVIVLCVSSSLKVVDCYKNTTLYDDTLSCGTYIPKNSEFSSSPQLKSEYLGGNCHALNVDSSLKLKGTKEGLEVRFHLNSTKNNLTFFLYTSEEYKGKVSKFPLWFDKHTSLQPGKHQLHVSQTFITRLPHPYSSSCKNTPNPLSSFYTKSSCLQMCEWNEMMQKCGHVPDIAHKYVNHTSNIVHNYLNSTLSNITDIHELHRTCMDKVRISLYYNRSKCNCQLACMETKFKVRTETYYKHNVSEWFMYFNNEDNKVTQISQVPSYTLEDVLGAVGGILGLAIGASSLSVIEILVYCALFVASMVY